VCNLRAGTATEATPEVLWVALQRANENGERSVKIQVARALAVCLVCCLCCVPATAGDLLLLKNARSLAPSRRSEYAGHILVRGDKIEQVMQDLPADFTGEVVDLSGKYLLPGLVDAHVHSEGNRGPGGEGDESFSVEETARRMLYCGVTAYLDAGLAPAKIFPARARLRAHEVVGADVYAVGPVFYGVPHRDSLGHVVSVETPEQVREALFRLAESKPDLVKIIFDWTGTRNTMSLPIMRAIVETSKSLGLRTMVHIGSWANARLAADAGADVITHLNDTTDLPADVARLFAAKFVAYIPTLAVQQDFLNIAEDRALLDNAMLRSVVRESLLDKYRSMGAADAPDCRTCRWQREGRKHYGISMRRLLDAGVNIVAGSDTSNEGTFQGFSLHRELILLHEAGLDNWDALASATTRAYRFLGLSMGIEPGADATLLVLTASPVQDIAHTQTIERILFHGQWVDRDALAVKR